MDSDSFLILIAIICVILSGYFSATETAFSSMNVIRMKAYADDGNRRAALALKMVNSYDKLLSTILIGNNIVNILMASLATVLFVRHFGDMGASLSTLVTTVIVLIFGEISPKSLAKESPESFAMFSAPILHVLLVVLTPLNFLFVQWKKLLSRLFKSKRDDSITERELLTMVEEAAHEGGIDEQESELIRSAIEFNDVEAIDIFTPRVDVVGVPEDADRTTVARIFTASGHSRLPVYRETMDNIVGLVHQRDFYLLPPEQDDIRSIVKPALFITKSMKIGDLLRMLQKNKSHMAVICDEFGGTMGIVTMEDILEELVGDIWDEHEVVVQDIVPIDETTFRVKGSADLDEFLEFFHLARDVDEEASTVNGWALSHLGEIPDPGDRFTADHLSVTVEQVDNQRIRDLLVTVQPPAPNPDTQK